MAEVYAKEAALRDDRVQELSFNATAGVMFTKKAYVESPYKAPQEAGVTIAGQRVDLELARDLKYVADVTAQSSLANLKEFDCSDYEVREMEAKSVKLDVGNSDDIRAAAEINEDVAKKRCEDKKEDKEIKTPKFFSNFVELFRFSFSIRFFEPDETVDKKVEKELDRRIFKEKELKQALETKFSKTFSYGDTLLEARAGALKKMAAPVQNTDKKYADL
jgi:hypothetical protein